MSDHRALVTFGLGVIGAAVILGTLVGAAYGTAREMAAACCSWDES